MKGLGPSIRSLLRDARSKYIGLPLLRLAYRFKYWVLKRIPKVHLELYCLLRQQIRSHIAGAKSEGYDDHQDMVINIVAWKLHRPDIFKDTIPEIYFNGLEDEKFRKLKDDRLQIYNSIRDKYKSAEHEVNVVVEQLESNKEIQMTIKTLCLIDAFVSDSTNAKGLAQHYLKRAKEIDPHVEPLQFNDLDKIRKETRKETKRLRNIIADKEAVKLTINPTFISTAVVLASSLFLISGYLYDRYYLGAFGIDVSKYFVLADYLSSSIEALRYAAVAAISGLVWMFLGIHHTSRMSYAQIEYEHSIIKNQSILFVIIAVLSLLMGYVIGGDQFYHGLLLFVIIISYFGIGEIAHKYFKEPIQAIFVMAFTTIFFSYLYYSAANTVYEMRHGSIKDLKKWEFTFSSNVQSDQDRLVLLAGNSGYFFFWDVKEKVSIIVPREGVVKIVSKSPSP